VVVGSPAAVEAQQPRVLKMQSSFPANSTAHDGFNLLP
jgi:hypothetical protein